MRLGRGCEEMTAGLRALDLAEAFGRPAVEDLAALFARAGTDVDDPVGAAHDVELVLHDEERVAGALERIERAEERLGVGRVQAGGGLVEDVDDAEEVGVQLRGEAEALQLAGRERGRAALEREVAEAEIEQHVEALGELGGDAPGDLELFRAGRMGAASGRR